MKKKSVIILALTMVMVFTLSASSVNLSESIKVYRNLIKLDVNGLRVNTDNFLYNGTTYVPLRAIGELLNKDVGWNSYSKTASIDDNKYEIEELSSLLPAAVGFTWDYEGFAEYSHHMELDKISDNNLQRVYHISGEVGDPSDGEAAMDKDITIKYTISDNKLVQEKQESSMLDSKYDKITLIEAPLVAGTFWREDVVDKRGRETSISAFISKVEITEDGSKEYTLRYDDDNSDYYEIRVIRQGLGLVSFEKLLELEDTSFPATYFIFKTSDAS